MHATRPDTPDPLLPEPPGPEPVGSAPLTPEHRELRRQVRAFAEKEVAPRVAQMEASRALAVEVSRSIARQGWIGVTVGREYGGLGLGHLAKAIVVEELSRVSGAMGAMTQASQLGVAKILHFGSRQQRQRWLPAVAAGQCLPTIAVTEPDSGSHVLGMDTRADREGEGWVLTGRKVYVGNAHIGDLHGVVARTGPGPRGLTAFLVPAGTPGCQVTPHTPSMGLHGFGFGEIVLDACRLPAGAQLGREGQGLEVAYSSSVLYGRSNLAAVALGLHQALVEETIAFARARTRYGAPLAELPIVHQRIGAMTSRLMTSRQALYTACRLQDAGQPCDAELMNAKLLATESVLESARAAMDIHGACALYPDRPIERLMRDAQHLGPPAGTSDIQRHRLAEIALGHYHQPWSARLATPAADTTRAKPE